MTTVRDKIDDVFKCMTCDKETVHAYRRLPRRPDGWFIHSHSKKTNEYRINGGYRFMRIMECRECQQLWAHLCGWPDCWDDVLLLYRREDDDVPEADEPLVMANTRKRQREEEDDSEPVSSKKQKRVIDLT